MGIMGDWMDKHLTFVPVMKKAKIILKISDIKYDMLLPMSSTGKRRGNRLLADELLFFFSDRANALQRGNAKRFRGGAGDRGNAKRFRGGTAG